MKKREVKSKQSSCVTDLADRADDGKASPLPCDPMEMKRKVNKRKRGYDMKKEIARSPVEDSKKRLSSQSGEWYVQVPDPIAPVLKKGKCRR